MDEGPCGLSSSVRREIEETSGRSGGHLGRSTLDIPFVFGRFGSRNDLNVVFHSPTIQKIPSGKFPPAIPYKLSVVTRNLPYYLADGIYPSREIFVKTIKDGSLREEKLFAIQQGGVRKYIER